MRIREEVGRRDTRIDLIPLLDCIFLLVVFFMYAMLTMVTQQGLPLNLPTAYSATTSSGERITLSLDNQGQVHWDDEALNFENLEDRLLMAAQSPDKPWVYVRADRETDYGLVVQVLDLLRKVELSQVSLETHEGRERGGGGR